MTPQINMASVQLRLMNTTQAVSNGNVFIPHRNRELHLGELSVARALPIRDRRMVGPWCFLDRFSPLTFAEGKPMQVLPHPHTGLQTITWLLEGEVLHDDVGEAPARRIEPALAGASRYCLVGRAELLEFVGVIGMGRAVSDQDNAGGSVHLGVAGLAGEGGVLCIVLAG